MNFHAFSFFFAGKLFMLFELGGGESGWWAVVGVLRLRMSRDFRVCLLRCWDSEEICKKLLSVEEKLRNKRK